MSRIVEIHVICHEWPNIEYLGKEYFTSGDWKIDEEHLNQVKLDKGISFALHEKQSELSYLQGIIKSWKRSLSYAEKIIVEFKATNIPIEWKGEGIMEKSYLWGDD